MEKNLMLNDSQWDKVEAKVAGIAKNKASKFAKNGGLHYDYDDAIQEGRLALLLAMPSFTEEKGALHSFASTVLENSYRTAMARIHTKSRSAFTVPIENAPDFSQDGLVSGTTRGISGSAKTVLLEQDLIDEDYNLERNVEYSEMEAKLMEFKGELRKRLSGFPQTVFDYKMCPMLQETVKPGQDVQNIDLAGFFGVTKNKLDYALYVIKGEVTALARKAEYEDVFGNAVSTLRWPQFAHSKRAYDQDAVEAAMAKWNLNADLKSVKEEKVGDACRCIEEYDWGMVIYWGMDVPVNTTIAVGRFNPLTGELFGTEGTRDTMPNLSQYREVVKTLKGKK